MALSNLQMILLAVIQGVTEFLPISSSGHLVLLQDLMAVAPGDNMLVVVTLHAGTLLAILVYYSADLLRLVKARDWLTVRNVVLGTIPVVIVGLAAKSLLDEAFENPWVAVGGLVCTAFLLLWVYVSGERAVVLEQMTWRQAVGVGLIQCIAILPGISRSGSTIAMGTRLGLKQEDAARFSFFLAIPAIGGATTLEVLDFFKDGAAVSGIPTATLVLGFAVSFGVGLLSLIVLIRTLRLGKFSWFGYYCLCLAAVTTLGHLFLL